MNRSPWTRNGSYNQNVTKIRYILSKKVHVQVFFSLSLEIHAINTVTLLCSNKGQKDKMIYVTESSRSTDEIEFLTNNTIYATY